MVLLSDTHGFIHPEIFEIFEGVEAILHAGDVGESNILLELEAIAPTHAVSGNCDYTSMKMPLVQRVNMPFGGAALAHGHTFPIDLTERIGTLLETFPAPETRLILTGHSHLQHLQFKNDVWVINPGAACRPRFSQKSSVCLLKWNSETDQFGFEFLPLQH